MKQFVILFVAILGFCSCNKEELPNMENKYIYVYDVSSDNQYTFTVPQMCSTTGICRYRPKNELGGYVEYNPDTRYITFTNRYTNSKKRFSYNEFMDIVYATKNIDNSYSNENFDKCSECGKIWYNQTYIIDKDIFITVYKCIIGEYQWTSKYEISQYSK